MRSSLIFVSHAGGDRAAALEIVAKLEKRGIPCLIAPRDVPPGCRFDDWIATAINDCRAMLLIFSNKCNENDYIYREVTVAGDSRREIIPCRIEKDAKALGGLGIRLSNLHWLDWSMSPERVIDEIAQYFAAPPAPGIELRRPEEWQPNADKAAALVQIWLNLGQLCAKCDSRIFEYLFLYRLGEGVEERDGIIRAAYDLAYDHIGEVLDSAARAFKILTGYECDVTIKCAVVTNDTLQTLYRVNDKRGGARDKEPRRLSANKPTDSIANGQMTHFICDDLKSAFARGEYSNSQGDWSNHYNATIVHRIDIHAGNSKKSLKDMAFLICVDNNKGGFESNEYSLEIIKYISHRVSAMLYRAEMLNLIINAGK